MGYKKCPRCELNYILDTEKMCTVCQKDVSGEKEADDMIEMCSECGENPAMPGQELCSECYKALQRRNAVNSTDDSSSIDPSSPDIDIDSVSGMEEMEEVKTTDEDGMDFSEDDDTLRDDEDEDKEDAGDEF